MSDSILKGTLPQRQRVLEEAVSRWASINTEVCVLASPLVGKLIEKFGTLRAAAAACGVSPTYMSMIHTGKAMPSVRRCLHLLTVYNLD